MVLFWMPDPPTLIGCSREFSSPLGHFLSFRVAPTCRPVRVHGMVWISIVALTAGLILGWLVRHYFKTPGFKSDTTQFFRQSGSNIKFYTPATLRLTLYMGLACVNFSDEKVGEWDAMEAQGKIVSQRQYERFRLGNARQALIVSIAFIDNALSKANRKRLEHNTRPPTLG